MNNLQLAQELMHTSLNNFIDSNAPIYAADAAMQNAITGFKNKLAEIKACGDFLATDKKALTQKMLDAKLELASTISTQCKIAIIGMKNAGVDLSSVQFELHNSAYVKMPHAEFVHVVNQNRDLLSNNLATLTPTYFTAQDLTQLDQFIATYGTELANSKALIKAMPAKRAEYRRLIDEVRDIIDNIRVIAKRYKTTNTTFYEQLLDVSTVKQVNVHHTSVQLTIKRSTDGAAIANAAVTFNNSKKQGQTDETGKVTINEIRNGKVTVTVQAAGFQTLVKEVHIEQGKENVFEVTLAA